MTRFSVVVLVDARGWLLLQERDEHAPLNPDMWGLVGGHVEDGEDFEPAAYRELEEETGVRLRSGELTQWRREHYGTNASGEPNEYAVWVGPTTATDADIVLGEGRRIVFVHPSEVEALDLAPSARHFLSQLLASDVYAGLVGA